MSRGREIPVIPFVTPQTLSACHFFQRPLSDTAIKKMLQEVRPVVWMDGVLRYVEPVDGKPPHFKIDFVEVGTVARASSKSQEWLRYTHIDVATCSRCRVEERWR